MKARGSVEQVYVTGAKRGAKLTLTRNGERVARKRAGRLGAAVFRNVKPGRYRLAGKRIRVLPDRSKPPRTKLYRQRIPKSGYGYLTTRDGTQLAINVHLPSRRRARTRRWSSTPATATRTRRARRARSARSRTCSASRSST